nr:opioid growth factor receptor-related protein [Parashewanella hymeniacidonis]
MNFIELENDHNFIQVLFPNPKPSPINRKAPLYTELMQEAIHVDATIQTEIRKNVDIMLKFYGLVRNGNDIHMDTSNAQQAKSKWLKKDDHNHKRLSRILIFLYNSGFGECADSLKLCITTNGKGVVKERNLQIWNGLVRKNDVMPLVFT